MQYNSSVNEKQATPLVARRKYPARPTVQKRAKYEKRKFSSRSTVVGTSCKPPTLVREQDRLCGVTFLGFSFVLNIL